MKIIFFKEPNSHKVTTPPPSRKYSSTSNPFNLININNRQLEIAAKAAIALNASNNNNIQRSSSHESSIGRAQLQPSTPTQPQQNQNHLTIGSHKEKHSSNNSSSDINSNEPLKSSMNNSFENIRGKNSIDGSEFGSRSPSGMPYDLSLRKNYF